jgi:hypothetical protein
VRIVKKRISLTIAIVAILISFSCKKYCRDITYSNPNPDLFIVMPTANSFSLNTSVYPLQVGIDSTETIRFAVSACYSPPSSAYTDYRIKVSSTGKLLFYSPSKGDILKHGDIVKTEPPNDLVKSDDVIYTDAFGDNLYNGWNPPKYLGFNVIRNGKNYAGWVKIGVDAQFNLTIYEYALNTCDGRAIKAGKN